MFELVRTSYDNDCAERYGLHRPLLPSEGTLIISWTHKIELDIHIYLILCFILKSIAFYAQSTTVNMYRAINHYKRRMCNCFNENLRNHLFVCENVIQNYMIRTKLVSYILSWGTTIPSEAKAIFDKCVKRKCLLISKRGVIVDLPTMRISWDRCGIFSQRNLFPAMPGLCDLCGRLSSLQIHILVLYVCYIRRPCHTHQCLWP